jgi:hypothetical protein
MTRPTPWKLEGRIENDGNTLSWPILLVYPPSPDLTEWEWSVLDERGLGVRWAGEVRDEWIEVDMYKHALVWEGDPRRSAVYGLELSTVCFWSVPIGGVNVTAEGGDVWVIATDAWVI